MLELATSRLCVHTAWSHHLKLLAACFSCPPVHCLVMAFAHTGGIPDDDVIDYLK